MLKDVNKRIIRLESELLNGSIPASEVPPTVQEG